MISQKDMLKVLTLEEIKNCDLELINEKVEKSLWKVKLISANKEISFDNLKLESLRAMEISNSLEGSGLSKNEKALFASKLKFHKIERVLDGIKNISFEELEEFNQLLTNFKYAYSKYLEAVKTLRNIYKLDTRQVSMIKKLYKSLEEEKYQFNSADIETYNQAVKLEKILILFIMKVNNTFEKIALNPATKKLVQNAKNYYGLSESQLYLSLNRINEILITNPEMIKCHTKQKVL